MARRRAFVQRPFWSGADARAGTDRQCFRPRVIRLSGLAAVRASRYPVSGGGFRGVAVEHEGRAFASWFNERGITLAVLKYRLPNGRREIPGEDIRGRYACWKSAPESCASGLWG